MSDKKNCIACGNQIPVLAEKCSECGSFQNWRRHLNFSSTLLALLVALISVLSTAVPSIVELFEKDNSRISILQQSYLKGTGLVLIIGNTGKKPGGISKGYFVLPLMAVVNAEYVDDKNVVVAKAIKDSGKIFKDVSVIVPLKFINYKEYKNDRKRKIDSDFDPPFVVNGESKRFLAVGHPYERYSFVKKTASEKSFQPLDFGSRIAPTLSSFNFSIISHVLNERYAMSDFLLETKISECGLLFEIVNFDSTKDTYFIKVGCDLGGLILANDRYYY